MEPESSLLHLQVPATPSLSRARSIHSMPPHPNSLRPILILSSHLSLGFQSDLPSGFPTKNPVYACPFPTRAICLPISFFSILSPEQYWVRITDNRAPHYVVFSTPLLPRPS
jgi:hypothetical protein